MKLRVAMVVYNDLAHDARVNKEARTVAGAGHSVCVIGMRERGSARPKGWEGLSVRRLCVGPWKGLRLRYLQFWAKVVARLLQMRPDIIHAHDLDVLPPCHLAAAILRVPLVHDAHELWTELATLTDRPRVRAVWRALENTFLPRCDAVITVCDGIADILYERHGVRPIVLRNMPPRQPLPQARPLREELGLAPETPLLIYQGGMLHGVGIERSIEVMEHLPEATPVRHRRRPAAGGVRPAGGGVSGGGPDHHASAGAFLGVALVHRRGGHRAVPRRVRRTQHPVRPDEQVLRVHPGGRAAGGDRLPRARPARERTRRRHAGAAGVICRGGRRSHP